jgi:hypothetical protein
MDQKRYKWSGIDVDVTLQSGESASKRDRLLRPWLILANLLQKPDLRKLGNIIVDGPTWTILGETSAFPSESPEDFYGRFSGLTEAPELKELLSVYDLFNPYGLKRLQRLTMGVALVLDEISTWRDRAPDERSKVARLLDGGTASIEEENHRIVYQIHNPFQAFLKALNGLDHRRIRRCPICGHLFYAPRKDKKACSKSCIDTLRVRTWRQNTEPNRERALELARRGKDVTQISKELRVRDFRVRRWLTQKEKA